jgi:hypothetical protein
MSKTMLAWSSSKRLGLEERVENNAAVELVHIEDHVGLIFMEVDGAESA